MAYTFIVWLFVLFVALMSIISGIIFMMRQKVVYDKEGNSISIEIPIFGKLMTNVPSLAFCFLGIALAYVALNNWVIAPDLVEGTGTLDINLPSGTDEGLLVQAAITGSDAKPSKTIRELRTDPALAFRVPKDWVGGYTAVVVVAGQPSVNPVVTGLSLGDDGKLHFTGTLEERPRAQDGTP